MADTSSRTVAEKLAAAKKKHKAYLKEKALKSNSNKTNGQETKNVIVQNDIVFNEPDKTQIRETEAVPDIHLNVVETLKSAVEPSANNAYEADLPLPQYPVENSYPASTLPDPLSFFDNFNYTNVGSTLQTFTQPLTSFFNNTNRNEPIKSIETPNQVLVEEYNMNTSNVLPTHNDSASEELFTYDKFKMNAINNPFRENKTPDNSTEMEKTDFIQNPVFDEFTNSIGSSESQNLISGYQNFEKSTHPFNATYVINQELNTNNYYNTQELSVTENIQENEPTTSDVSPDSKPMPSFESENKGSYFEVNNENEPEQDKFPSSLQSAEKLSNEMKAYVTKEEELLCYSNIPSDAALDERNQELRNLVEQQNAKCVELSQKLYESEMRNSKLETNYRQLEMTKQHIESELNFKGDIGMMNELSKLREDLQCHLQTIGMLVAEKTELTALLQETQIAFKNESSQSIDLQNKIKEMKIYYSDLENELQSLKSEKTTLNSSQKEQTDVLAKIQKELAETRTQCEEHTQDLLESREKLKAATENNTSLQNQIQELSGQLSMANIKIQQLTLQESSHLESQIQKLLDEKSSNEKQISMLNETLKTVSKEREESSLQYQQYAEQLNDQISNLVQRLEQQQRENEQFKIQEENRIQHIGDLEKQLQNVQNDNTSYNLQRNVSFLKKELESSAQLAQTLQTEKEQGDINLTKALTEKEMLEKELNSCKVSISQLESTVEQLRGSQPDNALLLATMESDKVAASRAMAQNNELKKQMEGMQEVMLKVNNDNVQLTETMSRERQTNKELFEKLQKTEISLQTLATAIEIKDRELMHLRDQIEVMSKTKVQQEQLLDRLRHYEAQNHSSPSLQVELQEAKQMIAHLTNELNILKRNQLNQTNQMNQTVPIDQTNQINQTVPIDQMNQINQTNKIDQINQNTQTNGNSRENIQHDHIINSDPVEDLRAQLNNLQIRNKELESLLKNVQSTDQKRVDTNGNEHLDKETAMMHLEKKFLRTMEEIARLTEEKQRLEHLVLQLQSETETIGEYVTLYQQQRSILKQRALEKDQQLQQLTNDRETIKGNLDRLNNLIKKLIVEKGSIPKELLEQHEHFSKDRNDLCLEHQQIHQEINKITSNGLNNPETFDNSNTEIAKEIISLLSEIKSSNLVQPDEEGLHHCPWCSGKLITV